MAVIKATEQLKQEETNIFYVQYIGAIVHVLFEIFLHVFKDQSQGRLIEDDIMQADDIAVFETFQQAHFT